MSLATAEAVMPRRGRPLKPADQKLTETIPLRLTAQEADSAYRLAIKHGTSLNAVLRAVLRRLSVDKKS